MRSALETKVHYFSLSGRHDIAEGLIRSEIESSQLDEFLCLRLAYVLAEQGKLASALQVIDGFMKDQQNESNEPYEPYEQLRLCAAILSCDLARYDQARVYYADFEEQLNDAQEKQFLLRKSEVDAESIRCCGALVNEQTIENAPGSPRATSSVSVIRVQIEAGLYLEALSEINALANGHLDRGSKLQLDLLEAKCLAQLGKTNQASHKLLTELGD
jgi:hypothetical protein